MKNSLTPEVRQHVAATTLRLVIDCTKSLRAGMVFTLDTRLKGGVRVNVRHIEDRGGVVIICSDLALAIAIRAVLRDLRDATPYLNLIEVVNGKRSWRNIWGHPYFMVLIKPPS